MKALLHITFILLCGVSLFAQIDTTRKAPYSWRDSTDREKYVSLFKADDPLMEEPEAPAKEFKKKRPKRKVYYGVKTRKAFTKEGYGTKQVIEIFHVVKKPHEQVPNTYLRKLYWYDPIARKIVHGKPSKFKAENGMQLLHGPYKKMKDNEIIEKGIYYKGGKHGRWEQWGPTKNHVFKKDTIVDEIEWADFKNKTKWDRGWPREYQLSFYDRDKTLLKEVMPFDNGQVTGGYYRWFENGQLAEYGHYQNGKKVGKWLEWYEGKKKTHYKKIMMYPESPLDDSEPKIIKEWNEQLELIIDNEPKSKKKKKFGH